MMCGPLEGGVDAEGLGARFLCVRSACDRGWLLQHPADAQPASSGRGSTGVAAASWAARFAASLCWRAMIPALLGDPIHAFLDGDGSVGMPRRCGCCGGCGGCCLAAAAFALYEPVRGIDRCGTM